MDILVQIVQVIYILITVVLILVVLLQAGRGGGLGTALGGGASQSVFGGSGGADFLAKLTQGLAVGFMVCAVYLAYASAHSGSSRLQDESKKITGDELLADDGEAVNYERVGPNPLPRCRQAADNQIAHGQRLARHLPGIDVAHHAPAPAFIVHDTEA
jgi:preprotein translocase subunit SecG